MPNEEERKISTYETYISSPSERTVLLVRPRHESWIERVGFKETRTLSFWRSILAEYVISLLFILFACGSTFNDANALHQGISVGFLEAVLICVMPENGGFFNPAIALGLLISRRMKYARFFFNITAQIVGSMSGAGLLYLYSPKSLRGNLGLMSLHGDVSGGIGFIMEMTLTFVLMWTVLTSTDPDQKFSGFQSPLAIGFAITVGILTGFPFTGGALNPIRAFGPAVIMNNFANHWVYWVGPLVGGMLAALSYEYLFKPMKVEHKRSEMPTVKLHINAQQQASEL